MATISLMATGCLHQRASERPGHGNDAERTSASVLIASPTCFTSLTPITGGLGVSRKTLSNNRPGMILNFYMIATGSHMVTS